MRALMSGGLRLLSSRGGQRAALSLLALVVLGLAPVPGGRWAWLAGAVVVLAAVGWGGGRWPRDRFVVPHLLLLAGVLAMSDPSPDLPLALAALALMASVLADSLLASRFVADTWAVGLPGYRHPSHGTTRGPFLWPSVVGTAVLLPATAFSSLTLTALVAVAAVLAVGAVIGARDLLARRRGQWNSPVTRALEDFSPAFYVYYSGAQEGGYQLTMWLPYLDRLELPYAVLVREEANLEWAAELSSRPAVFVRRVEAMPSVLVDSVRTIFYVNNEIRNAHGVRFIDRTHVHLGHGDSDKPPSYAPTTAMFDQIFVAGQAGVDRFAAHDVLVPAEKFRLVGRPQLARIEVGPRPDGSAPTVLYAPTWRGGLPDMTLSSLFFGPALVTALLDLGVRVVFRPHPYSKRDAASRVQISRIDDLLRAHPGGHTTSAEAGALDLFDCFNASDALVCDISSVASDYLYSRKPFAVADTGVATDLADEFPLVAGAYVVRADEDPRQTFTLMLGEDPLRAERERVGRYYLGDADGRDPVETFVAAARAAVTGE